MTCDNDRKMRRTAKLVSLSAWFCNVSLAHSITASQHHSITASQHHSITASQHHSITAPQHISSQSITAHHRALQWTNITGFWLEVLQAAKSVSLSACFLHRTWFWGLWLHFNKRRTLKWQENGRKWKEHYRKMKGQWEKTWEEHART